MSKEEKCGFVSLIGAPNAGKSTLINALIGEKLAIVTHKAQTTRLRLRAVANRQKSQIIFIDTPGIFEASKRFERALIDEAWAGAGDGDFLLFLFDASKPISEKVEHILEKIKKINKKIFLILNKIDLVKKEKLLEISKALHEKYNFEKSFMISALKNDGVEELLEYLACSVPPGKWMYPEEQIADIPLRLLAAEITREVLFLRLHQELPYAISVETEKWKESKKEIHIHQTIYVSRKGQKAIVLGAGGETIKQIGTGARLKMKKAFGKKVNLFLFVKHRENWQDDPQRYASLGLSFPKER